MTNYSTENGNKITNELIIKKSMPKLWSCFVPQTDEQKKSKQIDNRIKEDQKVFKNTYRLLLLGMFILISSLLFLKGNFYFFKVRVNQVNQQL